jgi:hypothetical protein
MEELMRIIEIEEGDRIDGDLLELLIVSGKLKTEEQLMRKALLDAVDPVIATGPEFEFEDRPDDEMYISLDVPDSGSRVDLAVAWTVAQADAKACALVLERDHSFAATLRVYKNTLGWLRFWSRRFPNDQQRMRFERQLSERKARLEWLKDEAGYKFKFHLLEELKAI